MKTKRHLPPSESLQSTIYLSLLLLQFAMQKISVPKELGLVASPKWKRKSVNEKKWMQQKETDGTTAAEATK